MNVDKYEAIKKLHEIRADNDINVIYRVWIAEVINFSLTGE